MGREFESLCRHHFFDCRFAIWKYARIFCFWDSRVKVENGRKSVGFPGFDFVIIGKVAERFNFGGLGIADERQLQTVEGQTLICRTVFQKRIIVNVCNWKGGRAV